MFKLDDSRYCQPHGDIIQQSHGCQSAYAHCLVTDFVLLRQTPRLPFSGRTGNIDEQRVTWQTAIYNGNDAPAHPIWPEAGRILVGDLGLQLQDVRDGFWWLPWRIFAEGMPETRGVVLLVVDGHFYVNNYEVGDVSWWGEAEGAQKFDALKDRFQL